MRILFLLFFIITGMQVVAQNDFRSGMIFTHEGDTLHGLIEYKGNTSNARKCTFKQTEESDHVTFLPTEIDGYRFAEGKYYISMQVPKEEGQERLFLEYLINGIVDIYYYRDESENYFVQDEKGRLMPLRNELQKIYVNDVPYMRPSRDYIRLLKTTFSKNLAIAQRVETIPLSHKSLIKITNEYHNAVCEDEVCIIYEKKLPKRNIQAGFTAGVDRVSYVDSHPDELYDYMGFREHNEAVMPAIGLYLKTDMPYFNENLYANYFMNFRSYKYNYASVDTIGGFVYHNRVSLKQMVMNNMLTLSYEFPIHKIQPKILAGLYSDLYFGVNYERKVDSYFEITGNLYFSDKTTTRPFHKSESGFVVGGGIKTKAIKGKELSVNVFYRRGNFFRSYLNSNNLVFQMAFQLW